MYIPKHFRMDDIDEIYSIVENYGFAILFSQHKGEPYATHLPLTLDRNENVLYGHFAILNEQWKDAENQEVLAVFQGPHCYISPTWYETDKAVPTWNYVAVHIYGKLEIIKDSELVTSSLDDLVDKYENPGSLYKYHNVDPDFMKAMTKGITPFRINITKIEGKSKLSQNHPVHRQKLIIEHLENTKQKENLEVAALMKKNLEKRSSSKA